MAYALACPACFSRLKTPQMIVAGTPLVCPKCRANFVLERDSFKLEVHYDSPILTLPEQSVQEPSRTQQIPLAESADSGETTETSKFDTEERPTSDLVFSQNAWPDRAARIAPKTVERTESVEEMFSPALMRARSKAIKKNKNDAEPETSRRKYQPRTKTGGNSRRMIWAIAVPVVLVILAGAGYGMYSLIFGGGVSPDMLAWAPNDTDQLSYLNYAKARKITSNNESLAKDIEQFVKAGVREDSIVEVMTAMASVKMCRVIRTKGALYADEIASVSKAEKIAVGNKSIYKCSSGVFHIPSPYLMVICKTEKEMTQLLQKDQTVTFSKEMQALVASAEGDGWHLQTFKQNAGSKSKLDSPIKSIMISVKFNDQRKRVMQKLVFRDDKVAKLFEMKLNEDTKLAPKDSDKRNADEKIEVLRNGVTVTVSAEGPVKPEAPLIAN